MSGPTQFKPMLFNVSWIFMDPINHYLYGKQLSPNYKIVDSSWEFESCQALSFT